jgi:cystathionine beta-lyase
MTHKSIPKEQRLQSGIGDSLIRLSCGIEDSHDLLNDIKSALNIATANTTPHQSFVHKNFNF